MSREPKKLATAEFTRDMVETLSAFFDDYQVEGVVRINVTDQGLWLRQRDDERHKFLGSVKVLNTSGRAH